MVAVCFHARRGRPRSGLPTRADSLLPPAAQSRRLDRPRTLAEVLRSRRPGRIAWAKLLARIGEHFPLEGPACGGDIRLIAFITEPTPIRKILTHLGEPLEPPPLTPARGPPLDWPDLVHVHDDRDVVHASPDELHVIDIHAI